MNLGKSQRNKEPRRVAAIAAYNAEGLFLWGKRNDSGKWTNPGGHMEPGEEPMEAARRELEEETGLKGQDFQYLGRGLAGRDGSVLVYCFRCIAEGEIDTSDDPDEECEEWRWVEPDDIPEEISSNLHSPKNILLRLLGLQDGDVEEPMEKKADPHFVEHNPYAGTALKIPKDKTKTRKQWDTDYVAKLAYHFAGGDLKRLRPVQIPTDRNMGSNMAVNKSRLALYKRMLKAKDRLPPVVVRRNGIGYDLLDGNHRLEAARQSGHAVLHALEVIDPPLKKGLPGLALVGALATGGAMAAPKPPAANEIYQAQGMTQTPWTHDSLHPDMWPIAHLESSWGQNQGHSKNRKGDFHTAHGAVGFKPITAHEEYLKSKSMQAKYPDLASAENFLKTFKADPKFYNLLASAHFARLKGRHGNPQAAAYAWRWGTGAAAKATKEQIENDAYVQKYTHMKLDQRTGQVIPDPMAKSEPLEKMAVGTIKPGKLIGVHEEPKSLRRGVDVAQRSPAGHLLAGHKIFDYSHHLDLAHDQYQLHVFDGLTDEENPERHLNARLTDSFGKVVGETEGSIFDHDMDMKYSFVNPEHRRQGLGLKMYEAIFAHAFHNHRVKTVSGGEHSSSAAALHQHLAAKHGFRYKAKDNGARRDETKLGDDFDEAKDSYKYTIKSELAKHEAHDPLEAMLAHDDPRERIMALRSKLVTPYHLRRALQDEDPDVRAAAARHPMMTSNLIEEALRHVDIHTREAALSRPDLQEHHLEQAIWDPELQTQAALHPGLTEEQRQKLIGAQETPEGLRGQLLAKSIGYLTYPKLGQPKPYSEPMVRSRDQHQEWLHTHDQVKDLKGLTAAGAVSYNRLKDKSLSPEKRRFSATVSANSSSLPATVAHETQHSVFAHLRQKFGNNVGQNVVSQTMQALDQNDLDHLKRLTDWKIKNRYNPVKEPEERIAYLQNYLQDGTWRKSAHKAMRIHMDRNAEKIAHDWAKQIWQKLRNRAESLGPEHVGVIRKDEEHIGDWLSKQSGDIDYNVSEDMLGLTNRTEQHLEVAKFLGGREPDRAIFRRALLEDCDLVEAALISVGVQVNAANRKAFRAVMMIQDYPLSKATGEKTHEVQAMMADGVEIADGVRRGLAADTQEELHLGGKHSAGSMMVRDPDSGQMYLVKPGSGPQSPAAGSREEHASQSRREAAFWHVAEAWGLSQRLPRADLLLINGAEVAVLHMLPFDWKNLEKLKFKDAGLPHKALEKYRQNGELHKWAIMDFVLGNPDRHGQNLMVGPQKEGYPVALIDHGSAFAGPDFDPATDRNSFIPYYLRAWKAEGWGELDLDQKLRSMPAVSGDTELQLRDWFHGINASDLEAILFRYGIDPQPALSRLAKIKALLDQPNLSEAVNRIWLMT